MPQRQPQQAKAIARVVIEDEAPGADPRVRQSPPVRAGVFLGPRPPAGAGSQKKRAQGGSRILCEAPQAAELQPARERCPAVPAPGSRRGRH